MSGTCINTIKIIGSASIGILTTSLIFATPNKLSEILTGINSTNLKSYSLKIKRVLKISNFVNLTLGSISSFLFITVFNSSPVKFKHPYLIYSAVGIPLSLGYIFFNNFKTELKLNEELNVLSKKSDVKANPKPQKTENIKKTTTNISSNSDELDKSYIHVSDDDEKISLSKAPTDDESIVDEDTDELSIEEEVSESIMKNEVVLYLNKIKSGYVTGGYVSLATFLISLIGISGDLLF